METSNVGQVGKTFQVFIVAYIIDPAQNSENEFFVDIENGCMNISVIPPTPRDSVPFEFDLYSLQYFKIDYATFDPPGVDEQPWYNCGTLKYTLVDAATEDPIDPNLFSLSTASSQNIRLYGAPNGNDPWVIDSPYEFKIKVQLGIDYLT